MKDGRHMLSGEGGTASSPRFKSKRRSEGPDIFKGFQRSKRRAQNSKRPIQISKRQAQKSERHLAFPDASAPVTRKLSSAEITGNLSKHRSQISKRRQSFSASSTPVTCTLSLEEITDNLSKISDKEEST
ncbi:hypothetical protein ACFX1R_004124 [Malus domestica]